MAASAATDGAAPGSPVTPVFIPRPIIGLQAQPGRRRRGARAPAAPPGAGCGHGRGITAGWQDIAAGRPDAAGDCNSGTRRQ
jgi:hypothetical protein